MSKININDITTQYGFKDAINARLQQIEDEFNNKVFYRNNPTGEPNSLNNDLDMGNNDILNINKITVNDIGVVGENSFKELIEEAKQAVVDCTEQTTLSTLQANASAYSAEQSASSATSAASSASEAQDAATIATTVISPATTTTRGIGRVAAVADGVAVTNGPAFLAAGTAGALKQAVRADYLTSGDFDLLNPGTYICDNTAGGFVHAPPNFNPVFVYTKEWVPSGASYILYDEARSFEGLVRVMHRTFVPSRGTWSGWVEASGIASYSKVLRATNEIDARLTLQAASGYDNVTLWPTGGKLRISRNTGDTSTENDSMLLNPIDGTINGVLPAPRPTAANFVTCGATLPAGGTWAYCISCWNSTGYYIQTYSGVAAGGTVVASGSSFYSGFAWRVA